MHKNAIKHDSRNTQIGMLLLRNVRVAINFAFMLLVACKQSLLPFAKLRM